MTTFSEFEEDHSQLGDNLADYLPPRPNIAGYDLAAKQGIDKNTFFYHFAEPINSSDGLNGVQMKHSKLHQLRMQSLLLSSYLNTDSSPLSTLQTLLKVPPKLKLELIDPNHSVSPNGEPQTS